MEKIKSYCNRCQNITNHTVKHEHRINDIVPIELKNEIKEEHFTGYYSYQIIECNGCEDVSFRKVDFFNRYAEFDSEKKLRIVNGKTFEYYYPERLQNSLVEKRIAGVPLILKKAYQELIESFNSDLKILCSAGLRAIVEGICKKHSINGKTLGDKIDKLGSIGLISKELSKSLHRHKFLGNYALHELEFPERDELKSAIELVEICLETIYGVPQKHLKLKELISKRKRN